jgi:hypothetical protein
MTPNFDLPRTVSVKPSELIPSQDRLGDQHLEMVSVFRSGEQEIYYFKRPLESRTCQFAFPDGIEFPERLQGVPAFSTQHS